MGDEGTAADPQHPASSVAKIANGGELEEKENQPKPEPTSNLDTPGALEPPHVTTFSDLQHPLVPCVTTQAPLGKRKREAADDQDEDTQARRKHHSEHDHDNARDQCVQQWIANDSDWASALNALPNTGLQSLLKRSPSPSDTNPPDHSEQSSIPRLWGLDDLWYMRSLGMYMDDHLSDACELTADDRLLCDKILAAEFPVPQDWSFQADHLGHILKAAKWQNKAWYAYHIGPHIMPSVHLSQFRGDEEFKHIIYKLDEEWEDYDVLYHSTPDRIPRPAGIYGLDYFALSNAMESGTKKLGIKVCRAFDALFLFYFYETVDRDQALCAAELQALHAASIACNTVIELYRKVGRAHELDRRILAFSVAHDNYKVKIYAHYAKIGDTRCRRTTWHRHLLISCRLYGGKGWATDDDERAHTPYHIALAICK